MPIYNNIISIYFKEHSRLCIYDIGFFNKHLKYFNENAHLYFIKMYSILFFDRYKKVIIRLYYQLFIVNFIQLVQ